MKTINVKPVEKILIKLNDREYTCSFNMMSTAYMQEELSKLEGTVKDLSPARMCSLALYSGIKANYPEFTLDEAMALTVEMDPSCYSEIINEFNEAMLNSMSKEDQMRSKKMIAQYLLSAGM